ncbi:MAG: DNA translocase FtsK 4TM domain-containing protein [Chitinispirillaceae bacterium]
MARKKTEKSSEKKKNGKVEKKHSDIGHGIWGLIYLSLGLLVLISLVAYSPEQLASSIDAPSHILGPYLGTSLASGLFFLFGYVPAFVFPLAVIYIGWAKLKNDPLKIKLLLFVFVLTLEVCFLLAIRYMPELARDSRFVLNFRAPHFTNFVGLTLVRTMVPIFGKSTFGPYFLISLAIVITVLIGLRLKPQTAAAYVWKYVLAFFNWVKGTFVHVKDGIEKSPPIREYTSHGNSPVPQVSGGEKEEKKKGKAEPEMAVAAATFQTAELENSVRQTVQAAPQQQGADPEEKGKKRLDDELAAFRAKRNEPIKIASIETEDVEPEPEPEDDGPMPQFEEHQEKGVDENTGRVPSETGDDFKVSNLAVSSKPYVVPLPKILPDPPPLSGMVEKETIEHNSVTLEKTLMNFGVEGKVVFVSPGPVVTRYEIELAPGIKVSKVVNLHDDISMAVGGQRIRIEAPIPGKSAVGIELPNPERQIVHFKHILTSDAFKKSKAKLPVIIGTNISGAAYVTDITKMPHVLIAGQTGSGKSVCINSVICSMLMTKKPEELRLIMIDPKKVELAFYERIPHLLSPVVTESKEAVKALQWGVREMERRYRVLAKVGARNIDSFNTRVEAGKLKGVLPEEDNKQLPFIVIIVDELADLMMTASKDVEGLIQRIAQLARAVGIHLIVATQRPSVDIITGPIKANLTSRIAFRTIQSTDSRTILGHVGAEKLLGMGDMLFLRNGAPEIERFHGAFISEEDVETIVDEIRDQQVEIEKIDSFHEIMGGDDSDSGSGDEVVQSGNRDELFGEAARIIVSTGQGSTSFLQRRMKIGYARAGRLMDELEHAGIVGPQEGSKVREVLVRPDTLEELLASLR